MSSVDKREGCIFCEKSRQESDSENLLIFRGNLCFVLLNLFPYTTGHLMIAPYEHTGSIEDLDPETLTEIMTVTQSCMAAIRKAFAPDGFNMGINIARIAGAGITDHVHLHLVPRWAGDSNFMTVVGETRVLPKTLEEVYSELKQLI